MINVKVLAMRVMNFGSDHGQKYHFELFGAGLSDAFKNHYAKMLFQQNVCS